MDNPQDNETSSQKLLNKLGQISPVNISKTTSFSMNKKVNSIPIIVCFLLLLLILIAFGIYLSTQKNNEEIVNTNTSLQVSPVTSQNQPEPGAAERTNTAFVTSIISYIFKGEIIDISETGGVKPFYNTRYDIEIKIKGEGDIPSSFYFSNDQLDDIKIIRTENGRDIDIKIDDLEVGDIIEATFRRELEKGTNQHTKFINGEIRII